MKTILFLVFLALHSRGFAGIFDLVSEEMKEHVEALQTLPDEIQTIIVQQWFNKSMTTKLQNVLKFQVNNDGVSSLAWKHTEMALICATTKGKVWLWKLENFSLSSQLLGVHSSRIASLTWSPDDVMLVSTSNDGIIMVRYPDTHVMQILLVSPHSVKSLAWNHDGTILAYGGDEGTINLRWTKDRRVLWKLCDRTDGVNSIAWSPDGKMIASGNANGTISLWKFSTGTHVATLFGSSEGITSIAWNPDGTMLAAASYTGMMKFLKSDGTLLPTLLGYTNCVTSLAWNPDGTLLASGHDDGRIQMWKRDGTLWQTFIHAGRINAVAWSPDGTILASGNNDGTVKLWEFSKPLLSFPEWENLTVEQALILKLIQISPRHALQKFLLQTNSENRESALDQALTSFSPETRQRIIDHYHLLQTLLTGNPMSNSL